MKNYEIIRRKNARQLLKKVALVACLGFTGFSLPFSHGQKVSRQKITSAQQVKTAHKTFTPVKVPEMELKNIREALTFTSSTSSKSLPKIQKAKETSRVIYPIEVTSPANNDVWEAGREYIIKWEYGGSGDVRIDLESASAGKPKAQYPIVSQAPNTGTYRFRVPYNWVIDPYGYVVNIQTLESKQSRSSQGTITVYTQPVDLECRIVDTKLKWQKTSYVFYVERKRWLEFNVLMRNKGVQSPVTIQNVLVRLIKQPEGVVVAQEEWGFSGIYHHDWYKLSEPIKFNISSIEAMVYPPFRDEDINFEAGNYRLEVELDPQNSLRENPECTYDNKDVHLWLIK
ncbi:MAG: hypothetical protein AMS27_17205 [Bacteroides sp. SM23_62_1]|nr:MAG: hypothetical protein AMS27_17205 [Bacteroides sp. SM23_62_1]